MPIQPPWGWGRGEERGVAGVAGSSWPLICSEADWKQIYFSCSSGASQLPDEGARACLLETQFLHGNPCQGEWWQKAVPFHPSKKLSLMLPKVNEMMRVLRFHLSWSLSAGDGWKRAQDWGKKENVIQEFKAAMHRVQSWLITNCRILGKGLIHFSIWNWGQKYLLLLSHWVPLIIKQKTGWRNLETKKHLNSSKFLSAF